MVPWADTEDPLDSVTGRWPSSAPAGDQLRLAISDRAWATTVLALQRRLPGATWVEASTVTSPIRAVKDPSELEALRLAGAAADRVAAMLQAGDIPLIGRTEAEVSADLGSLLVEEGHSQVNFAIVGSGPNAASPHHEPGARVIGPGETVVCDFGGTYSLDGDVGYCSDITRTVVTGAPTAEVEECYRGAPGGPAGRGGLGPVRRDRRARRPGGPGRHRGRRLRRPTSSTGPVTASASRSTRTPTWWPATTECLQPGHAFSVEPGIYLPGRFGMRLEDIVVIGEDGAPDPLNSADHGLVVVDA